MRILNEIICTEEEWAEIRRKIIGPKMRDTKVIFFSTPYSKDDFFWREHLKEAENGFVSESS